MTNGGFQNFLHAITGLPGGFGVSTPTVDTHDGWKGPIRKAKRKKKDDELKKRLQDKYHLPANVVLTGDFSDEDEEFLELFFFMDDS